MFLTITINTASKNRSAIKMHKRKINPRAGWKKAFNGKKRNFVQKVESKIRKWRRSLKTAHYKLNDQTVMF